MRCVVLTLLFIAFICSTGYSQETPDETNQQKVKELMQDSTTRSMIMEHIAENPKARRQMMRHMMKTKKKGHQARQEMMQMMKENPEMKQRIKAHMQMMQSMMEGKDVSSSDIREMAKDSAMMQNHMRCIELMGDTTNVPQN